MADADDTPPEDDRPEAEGAGAPTPAAKKKAAKKKVARKKAAKKKMAAAPAPVEPHAPERETVAEAPAGAAITSAPMETPGLGAAIAQWGPIVLVALLIVIFRAGGDSATARSLGSPLDPTLMAPGAPSLGEGDSGLNLPPLTLPGTDRLIEELTSSTWQLGGAGGPPAEAGFSEPSTAAAVRPMRPRHPAPAGASPYPGYPPVGQFYPGYSPQDPYWWTQGQVGAMPPPPPPPPPPASSQ